MVAESLILVASYLLGSIPCGLLVSRWGKGGDPRASGSGNIGATNVLRTAGRRAGALTLLGDVGKGYLAVWLASVWVGGEPWRLGAGLAAIIGHLFPVFLKFRGGKGVATSFGVLLALHPLTAVCTFSLWLGGFWVTRISSVGALLAFGLLPFVVYLLQGGGALLLFAVAMSTLIYFKHFANIHRLLKGTEKRIQV